MSYEPRALDTKTLRGAAIYWAEQYQKRDIPGLGTRDPEKMGVWKGGRSLAMSQMYRCGTMDEFEYILTVMDEILENTVVRGEWERSKREYFSHRDPELHAQILADHYAIYPDGTHIPGKIGKVQVGQRQVGVEPRVEIERDIPKTVMQLWFPTRRPIIHERHYIHRVRWPVYAGEMIEREANPDGADHITANPEGYEKFIEASKVYALDPSINNLCVLAALDAITARADLGSTAATIRGLDGSQPALVDDAETGTLGFECTMNATSFGAAADTTPGGTCTAAAVTDDSSADATITLSYCRIRTNGSGVDDIMDGSAGTASANFIFNTVSIIITTNVSMAAPTVSLAEG